MAFGPDQSNELRMLGSDHDDEHVSPDFPQDFGRINCAIRVFKLFGAYMMHYIDS